MMLTEKCQRAQQAIDDLVLAEQYKHQHATIRERSLEWGKLRQRLNVVLEQAGWLGLTPEDVVDFSKLLKAVRADARTALNRLDQSQDAASLAKDELWKRLTSEMGKATRILLEATKNRWQSLIDEIGRPSAPQSLKGKVASIPANRKILSVYEETYREFQLLARQVTPSEEGDVAALRLAATKCSETASELSYDVPAEVQVFFRAIDRKIGRAHV